MFIIFKINEYIFLLGDMKHHVMIIDHNSADQLASSIGDSNKN